MTNPCSSPRRAIARLLVMALLAATCPGCSTWHATTLPEPAPGAGAQKLGSVELRLVDGRVVRLRRASAEADSVRGELVFAKGAIPPGAKVAYARADIASMRVGQHSPGKTLGLVLLFTALVAGVTVAIVASSLSDSVL